MSSYSLEPEMVPFLNLEDFVQPSTSKRALENNADAVRTLLAADDVSLDCVKNFENAEIFYSDLSSLSREDLQLLGITEKTHQDDLLYSFQMLNRQNTTYESVMNSPKAANFNNDIVLRMAGHINRLRTSIASTNYKLRCNPPRDGITEEDGKHFVSRFVREALKELKNVTSKTNQELDALESMIKEREGLTSGKKPEKRRKGRKVVLLLLVGVGVAVAVGVWRLRMR